MAREVRLSMRVWDAPTRLFHWAIVVLVALAYVSWRLGWVKVHLVAGDAVLALLIFRALWGFAGSETSRFRHFLAGPLAALRELVHSGGGPDNRVGYGAAGGWMVLLLLLLLTAQTATGLFARHPAGAGGPLAETVGPEASAHLTAWHGWLWDALIAAILLHLLAILAETAFGGRTLVGPMITGRKRLPGRTRPPRMAGPLLALAILVLAAILTWVVVWVLPRAA